MLDGKGFSPTMSIVVRQLWIISSNSTILISHFISIYSPKTLILANVGTAPSKQWQIVTNLTLRAPFDMISSLQLTNKHKSQSQKPSIHPSMQQPATGSMM